MKLVRILSLALVLSSACGDDDSDAVGDGNADGSGADGSAGDGSGGDGSAGDGSGDGDAPLPAGDCDDRNCNIPSLFTCFQWTGDDAENAGLCSQLGGTPADGACPSGQVAGCKTPSPFGGEGCSVNWGYAPITEADVEADCDDRGGELISR